ncbi:hypothetical protein [Phaeobacter sp. 11ANDIMAR09]|uniref:hypothetical protein n=1 Tax=Phaeobacter sp. 11ANDIMAR09 TaxID=1225647 RepID=UPI0006C8629B|nr:hypothetical protein [Phaeobacter sp. 11ANDIMAR09]KPD13720.1 hypothetical protein AN476_03350 [Phaeobacter sp. 11ANDIMAR09]
MVHNNKVLTVSYGTFSCTLEGFEDSFGTMKAIAEYFRDLASDDRYFGAEPPQPDADMLARIAQREVARQVEARTSSEGIHLRTSAPEDATAPSVSSATDRAATAAPATAPAPAVIEAEAPAEEKPEDNPQLQQLSEDTTEVDPSEVELFDHPAERPEPAGLDKPQEPVGEEAEQEDESIAANPAATVDLDTIAAISAAVSKVPVAEHTAADDSDAVNVEFFEAEEAEASLIADRGTDSTPAADSIAAKLQRIRAVVSQTSEEEFSEDQHAEAFVESARAEMVQEDDLDGLSVDMEVDAEDDEISRVLDRLDLTADLAVAEPEAQEDIAAEGGDDQDAASSDSLISSILQVPGTQQEEADTVADASAVAVEDTEEAHARPRRGIRLSRRNKPAAAEPAITEPTAQSPVAARQAPVDDAPDEQDKIAAEDTPPAPETTGTAQPLRARIIKMKREDLAKAMASGTLEEVTEDDSAQENAEDNVFSADSSLNAEEEAELLRELAEVEAELLASNQTKTEAQPATSSPAEDSAAQDAPTSSEVKPPPSAAQAVSSPDSDVTRLMEAAESKLGDPDNATSRETYSHLRAAVAAAEADRSAGDNSAQADEAEPYREDLANVVRPRRPGADGAAKGQRPRGKGSRPAPLKLVAEQRIDPQPAAPEKPVRPRRIARPTEETSPAQTQAVGSFTDYVQDVGAAELHELLEAAASYLSFVEERDHFSRPQLMNKVRSVGHDDFNRENGLRSIGQLLREGKIERSENGHFSATDDIGFRPRKRAAG